MEREDWMVLDALSDDWESIEQIVEMESAQWPGITPQLVLDRLQALYGQGHVCLMGGREFDREKMVREMEETKDRAFWFGRTPSGDVLWEKYASEFCRP